jgi:hypothetical protein
MPRPMTHYKAEPVAPVAKTWITEVQFKTAKNGQRRATYYVKELGRWLPVSVVEAEYYVAIGQATEA